MSELKQCPYSRATKCNLEESCGGCETYSEFISGETTPYYFTRPNDAKAEDERINILERIAYLANVSAGAKSDEEYLKATSDQNKLLCQFDDDSFKTLRKYRLNAVCKQSPEEMEKNDE